MQANKFLSAILLLNFILNRLNGKNLIKVKTIYSIKVWQRRMSASAKLPFFICCGIGFIRDRAFPGIKSSIDFYFSKKTMLSKKGFLYQNK
jgi:hypothetical protein